jgi:hypothetical protein
MDQQQYTFITLVSAKNGHNIDKFKFHLELAAKKIVDESARRSHEFANMRHKSRGINNNNSSDSNIENTANDTIFGSTFSNMKRTVDLSEYRDKMKNYYENSRC